MILKKKKRRRSSLAHLERGGERAPGILCTKGGRWCTSAVKEGIVISLNREEMGQKIKKKKKTHGLHKNETFLDLSSRVLDPTLNLHLT